MREFVPGREIDPPGEIKPYRLLGKFARETLNKQSQSATADSN